jgi:20S proteasome alpha/beta subunit
VTIIVGIRCEEGIVIAADSRATMGVLGQETTRQDVQTKIEIPQNHPVILGFSGNVGLSQKILLALSSEWGELKEATF